MRSDNMPSPFAPEHIDTVEVECLIEVRGIYDGWSIARMKDGSLINRWAPDDRLWKPTQDMIVKMQKDAEND